MSGVRHRLYAALGGRKQANGYLYALMISVAVKPLGGSFADFAMWLAAALLGTSFAVAFEDRGRPE